MREILFRGIGENTDRWEFGNLVKFANGDCAIINGSGSDSYLLLHVIPETVGQYTGLDDKNGVKIFEGDMVRTHFSFGHEVTQKPFVIKWNKERAMFEGSKPKQLENDYLVTFRFFPEQRFLYEVIGNIHDNPEAMGETK